MQITPQKFPGRMFARIPMGQYAPVAVLIAVLSTYCGTTSAFAKGSGQFCKSQFAHDYERPFASMPTLHEPPPSEQLPFAPPHTAFTPLANSILVLGGGQQFTYAFNASPGAERTFVLNWIIVTRLVEVDSHGEAKKVIGGAQQRIGKVTERDFNELELRFSVPQRVAFYRADTAFWSFAGERLAQYRQYLRVLKPTFRSRLVLDSKVAHSGGLIQFRVDNIGTERIAYGEPFSVESYDGAKWASFPAAIGPWTRELIALTAGQAGRCQRFPVPTDMSPGLYRIRKDLGTKNRTLTAKFEVQS